jgi:hypothetical protein
MGGGGLAWAGAVEGVKSRNSCATWKIYSTFLSSAAQPHSYFLKQTRIFDWQSMNDFSSSH